MGLKFKKFRTGSRSSAGAEGPKERGVVVQGTHLGGEAEQPWSLLEVTGFTSATLATAATLTTYRAFASARTSGMASMRSSASIRIFGTTRFKPTRSSPL